METFTSFLETLGSIIWDPITLVLLLGTGIYLTPRMRARTQRNIFYAFRMMWQGRKVGIVMTGVWQSGETGAALSALAFSTGLPGGQYVATFGLLVFAFTTILGWSFYGERCVEYLFGVKRITLYRILLIIAIPLGAVFQSAFALADRRCLEWPYGPSQPGRHFALDPHRHQDDPRVLC